MSDPAPARSRGLPHWERWTDWPLMLAAVVFLGAYAVPVLYPESPARLLEACRVASWVTWAVFGVDFVVRLLLAEERLHYVVHHWYDVPILALPLLRPLRLLRLVPLLTVLNRRARTRLRGRVAVYVAGGACLMAFCAALAVLSAERGRADANIVDFGDAIWWAVTTMTTVGYGDRYPVTAIGRLVAAGLMVAGIALLGMVTATLASWLVEAVTAENEQTEDLQTVIRRLEAKVDSLSRQVEESSGAGGAARPAGSAEQGDGTSTPGQAF